MTRKSVYDVPRLRANLKSLYRPPRTGMDAAVNRAVTDLVAAYGPDVLNAVRAEVDRLQPQQTVEGKGETNGGQRPLKPDRPVPQPTPAAR